MAKRRLLLFWVCFYYIKFVPFERLDLNRHLCSDGEMMM
jgi:hypothetical protein